VLTIVKFIISTLTAITGLYIIIRPQSYARLAGFSAAGERGRVEIRAIMGGVFLGLGLAPVNVRWSGLYIRCPDTYDIAFSG
jgi:hypothetical protein